MKHAAVGVGGLTPQEDLRALGLELGAHLLLTEQDPTLLAELRHLADAHVALDHADLELGRKVHGRTHLCEADRTVEGGRDQENRRADGGSLIQLAGAEVLATQGVEARVEGHHNRADRGHSAQLCALDPQGMPGPRLSHVDRKNVGEHGL